MEKNPDDVPSASQAALREAMRRERSPAADYDDLLWIMAQDWEGQVDLRNPKSTARGLFQITEAQYYHNPNGVGSFGNAIEECQGGIRYVKDRYGTVSDAKAFWLIHKWF